MELLGGTDTSALAGEQVSLVEDESSPSPEFPSKSGE
jgi:hypothetical protein